MIRLLWFLVFLPGCAGCRPRMMETQVWTDIPSSVIQDTGEPDQPIQLHLAYRVIW